MPIELNPILTRESRARWRHQAFLLLFFGVAIFALIMYFCYNNALTRWGYQGGRWGPIQQQSSEVGAALFRQLTYYQVIGWMLLAPTLTATALAGERERGLLEGLQLSPLTPGAIVRGKLYSALTFAGLLLLSSLPIIALCFVLGGVSPGEFFGATAQTFLAILLGASIGLLVSARSRRASHAVGGTFSLVFLWGFGTAIGLALASIPGLSAEIKLLLSAPALVNPAVTMTMWWGDVPAMLPAAFTVAIEPWLLGWILQAALSVLLLWLCIGPVRRPFDEQYWVEVGAGTDVLELTAGQARRESRTGQKLKTRAPRGRWELPIAQHIRLQNPIMQRDLRAKFIFRRLNWWGLLVQGVIMLGASAIYLSMLWFAFKEPYAGKTFFPGLTVGIAIAMLLVPALWGAAAFTREREAGTWEGIRLSLLSPLEVILGKQVGAVAIAPVVSCALIPFIWPYVSEPPADSYAPQGSWQQVLLAFAFLFALAWFSAAWGLRISWSSRKTATSTAWTIASLFIALVILPPFFIWLLELFVRPSPDLTEVIEWLAPLHPLGCFSSIFDASSQSLDKALCGCLFLFGVGSLLLFILWAQMKNADD